MKLSQRIILSIILYVLLIITAIFSAIPTHAAEPAQEGPLDLTLVVRDTAGTPLMGVYMELYTVDPPLIELNTTCFTDERGYCPLRVPAGSYNVVFGGGWRGYDFVPAEQQNLGTTDDGSSGGFQFYFDSSLVTLEQPVVYLTFVVTMRNDGMLYPLWDYAADHLSPPLPYVPPSTPGEAQGNAADWNLSLDPLPTNPDNASPAQTTTPDEVLLPTDSAERQVVVDIDGEIQLTPTLSAMTSVPNAPVTQPGQEGSLLKLGFIPGLVCLLGLVTIIALVLFVRHARSRQRKA